MPHSHSATHSFTVFPNWLLFFTFERANDRKMYTVKSDVTIRFLFLIQKSHYSIHIRDNWTMFMRPIGIHWSPACLPFLLFSSLLLFSLAIVQFDWMFSWLSRIHVAQKKMLSRSLGISPNFLIYLFIYLMVTHTHIQYWICSCHLDELIALICCCWFRCRCRRRRRCCLLRARRKKRRTTKNDRAPYVLYQCTIYTHSQFIW